MPYEIQCRDCVKTTWVANIVDLIKNHIQSGSGKFICSHCSGKDTFIYRESKLNEKSDDGTPEVWERWIKGVMTVDSGFETYCPYIFLTADSEDSQPNGLHFHYYKDTRTQEGGKLKHGHGPGGPPVLPIEDILLIIRHLIINGFLSKGKIINFIEAI